MELLSAINLLALVLLPFVVPKIWEACWIFLLRPWMITRRFKKQGISGPKYRFVYGNLREMKKMKKEANDWVLDPNSNDIFPRVYFDTADQKKSLDNAKFELMSEVHKHLQSFSPRSLIRDGQLTKESLKSLFDKIDRNKDGKIQISELKDLTVEFGVYGRMKCDINEFANTLLADFDKDKDGELDEKEFEEGIMKLLNQYKFDNPADTPRQGNTCIYRTASDSVHVKNLSQGEEAGVLKLEMPKQTLVAKLLSLRTLKAVLKVIGGMLMVLFLAKPFMININLLSVTAGVPSFYAVFAVIPLVRNLKNTLSAHFCRKKDKARIASEKFSEIYRDVTMNNLMGMSIVLAIVYTKGLKWDYSTEALLAVVVGLAIGLPAYVRSTYPFWICVLAFAMYISSLVLIYLHFHLRGQN
ncbi:hypothetical protein F2Q68_00001367 [Brassica cretica]|uniref:EF-hand domain-containing protein n=1 Tax=Brassica cretica TaxID=69181 RepID=A0A8S9JMC3_BRACR|nr:hypothetical protein F2Q68_00001367 [Brassica cretica]